MKINNMLEKVFIYIIFFLSFISNLKNKIISFLVDFFGYTLSDIKKEILKYKLKYPFIIPFFQTEVELIEKIYYEDLEKICFENNKDLKIILINRLGELNEKRWYEVFIIPFFLYYLTKLIDDTFFNDMYHIRISFILIPTFLIVMISPLFRTKKGTKYYERILIENKLEK